MKHITSLFPTLVMPVKKDKKTERGELIRYFYENLKDDYKSFTKRDLTMKFVAMKVSHLKEFDLYYLKRRCEDNNKDFSFSKIFWSNLKV